MTGMQFADILRDARMFSGDALPFAWVREWKTVHGVPLGIAVQEAASAAGRAGFLALWLQVSATSFCGWYTADAAGFARTMVEAADVLRRSGAAVFPAAVYAARGADSFAAWSAAAYAGGLCASVSAKTDADVFLPWLRAMCARYAQE